MKDRTEHVHLIEATSNPDSEGHIAVNLKFMCEQGHEFEYYVHNHKGYTLSEETITKG